MDIEFVPYGVKITHFFDDFSQVPIKDLTRVWPPLRGLDPVRLGMLAWIHTI